MEQKGNNVQQKPKDTTQRKRPSCKVGGNKGQGSYESVVCIAERGRCIVRTRGLVQKGPCNTNRTAVCSVERGLGGPNIGEM
ncbi:hypothetical protein PILCRDRAFT_821437 [Piloderma croceum F 1598]|uniref:Uncharacterized protein n=1 Tax=Piloderma croceum (strain F 1598) TaxID=765440 RepID=A0A0C3B525_PILCF|nr:hypothetical protein PILCRDRAFT_821437 [Piloderma croceum F 1598]